MLRITADKTTAEYAADDIEEALRNVHSQKLRLKNWANILDKAKLPADNKLVTLYTDDDFNLVTSLVGASVQRMDHANTVRSWLLQEKLMLTKIDGHQGS